ncbi:MAG: TolC family protein [Bacteroidetes bacterium]|nr:TolC family protein [Bacteroidota bacterium]
MRTTISTAIIAICVCLQSAGQGTVPFLREVEKSNPVIIYYGAVLSERAAELKTGNTPGALSAGYGHFPGTPSSIGLKRTFELSQSFDFPTTYIIRGKLNRESYLLAETEFQSGKIGVLLEARLLAYDYILHTKRAELLARKIAGYDSLERAWKMLFESGAVSVLEMNRITTELAKARSEAASEGARLGSLNVRLDYISGGNAGLLDGAEYDRDELPAADDLAEARRRAHPAFMLKEQEYALALMETGLSRSQNLPGLEVGFGSEIIGNEHHTGPRVGISVPLWPNRNLVKLSEARAGAAATERDATVGYLVSETMAEYGYCMLVRSNLETVLATVPRNVSAMAVRALSEREITVTDYFAFMESEYEGMLTMLELECEYHKSVARLLDYMLAKQ